MWALRCCTEGLDPMGIKAAFQQAAVRKNAQSSEISRGAIDSCAYVCVRVD